MKTELTTLKVNGVDYVRADSVVVSPPLPGKRAVVVVDRGWIFAGDVTVKGGKIHLTRAVWLFRWETIGLDGVIADPKSSKVTIKPMPNGVVVPVASEIFTIPVSDDWGL